MAETQALAKAAFVLILVVLLVTLIAQQPPVGLPPGSLPPANASLTNLESTASQGFPTFLNPFSQVETRVFTVIGNGAFFTGGVWTSDPPLSATNNVSGLFHCANDDWWNCTTQADGAGSYVTVGTGDPSFRVNLSQNSGGGEDYIVADFVMHYQCRVRTTSTVVGFGISFGNGTSNFFVTDLNGCQSTTFANYTYRNDLSVTHTLGEFSSNIVQVVVNSTTLADFSYLSMYVDYTHTKACSGGLDGIACNLYNFARTVFDGILFFINGVIFVALILVWFLSLVVGFVGVFVGSLLWMVTIPGTPPLVSGIVLGLVVTLLLIAVLAFAGLVRGREP